MGQGLSKYQEKTGIAMDNYLEENLSKLNFATESESVQPDIPINKNAIQKSINKMDEIVQDAMTSKKELQELMKTSKKGDTGSLSAYLQSMTTVDSDDESTNDQNQKSSKQRSSSTEEQLDESSTDENENEHEDENEKKTEIPDFIPIHSKSSIYGSSHTILKVHDAYQMSPIPVKSASSIYGTSHTILKVNDADQMSPIPVKSVSSIYGTSQKLLEI
jgi:hypothetical protein